MEGQSKKNWNIQDKLLLQQFIHEKVKIIENKNTDTNTNQKKNQAWKEVKESFNQMASTKRTINQLKCQWNIIKISAKKEKATHMAEIAKTGGRPPSQDEAISAKDIRAWLPNEFFTCSPDVVVLEAATTEQPTCSSTAVMPKKRNIKSTEFSKSEQSAKTAPSTLIAQNELKCRLELHQIQMQNERKRGINLDLEKEILLLQLKKLKEN